MTVRPGRRRRSYKLPVDPVGRGYGCADEVAAEFGDHPEAAARRMSWARSELACIAATDRVTA
jgi:hypothetical protein